MKYKLPKTTQEEYLNVSFCDFIYGQTEFLFFSVMRASWIVHKSDWVEIFPYGGWNL